MKNQTDHEVKLNWTGNEIIITGPLSYETVNAAFNQFKSIMQQHKPNSMIIDLKEVSLCDSASLAFVINVIRETKKHNNHLSMINMPRQMIELAKVSGVLSLLPIQES